MTILPLRSRSKNENVMGLGDLLAAKPISGKAIGDGAPITNDKAVVPSTKADGIDEQTLIAECKRGRLQSFEPIVKHFQSRLGQVAYQVLRDETLAEEAVQTTFVKAWQKIRLFRGQCRFGTWLHRLCVNTSCDILRQRSRKREQPLPEAGDGESRLSLDSILQSEITPDKQSVHREIKSLVLQALEKLPEEQRLVIILREMQGLDYREIARTVKCREGTAMSRLFHARRKLRQLLEKFI
jgi:RNA polymerase sigma-70 factor (ECF subfamily)